MTIAATMLLGLLLHTGVAGAATMAVAPVSIVQADHNGLVSGEHLHSTANDECPSGGCEGFSCHCFCHGGVVAALTVSLPMLPEIRANTDQPRPYRETTSAILPPPVRPPRA